MVASSSPSRTGSPCSGAVLATMSSHARDSSRRRAPAACAMQGRPVGHAGLHAVPAVELADEQQPRLAVLEDLADRAGGQRRVQRHRDVAGHPDREVAHQPVRGVLRQDRDAGAGREARAPAGARPCGATGRSPRARCSRAPRRRPAAASARRGRARCFSQWYRRCRASASGRPERRSGRHGGVHAPRRQARAAVGAGSVVQPAAGAKGSRTTGGAAAPRAPGSAAARARPRPPAAPAPGARRAARSVASRSACGATVLRRPRRASSGSVISACASTDSAQIDAPRHAASAARSVAVDDHVVAHAGHRRRRQAPALAQRGAERVVADAEAGVFEHQQFVVVAGGRASIAR